MEFKELTSDELELLNEEERTQYDKERDLYNKRVAFVAYMEKMGALKIEQLGKRELKPIPVVKNPEVPVFKNPESLNTAVSAVEIPDYSVKPYEASAFSIPEIRKISTAGYGPEIRKVEKVQPKLKKFPEFEQPDVFTEEFVMPERTKITGHHCIAVSEIPEIKKVEVCRKSDEELKKKIGNIRTAETIVYKFEKPDVAEIAAVRIQKPEIAIPEKITASPKVTEMKCSIPDVAISEKITVSPKVAEMKCDIPNVEIPGKITASPKVTEMKCDISEVAIPKEITCAVPEIRAELIKSVDYQVPGFRTAERKTVKSVAFRLPERKEESFHGVKVTEPKQKKISVPEAKAAEWSGIDSVVHVPEMNIGTCRNNGSGMKFEMPAASAIQTDKIICPKPEVPQYKAAERKSIPSEKFSVKLKTPDLEKLRFELKKITPEDNAGEEKKRQFIERAEKLKNIVIPENWQDIFYGAEHLDEKQ